MTQTTATVHFLSVMPRHACLKTECFEQFLPKTLVSITNGIHEENTVFTVYFLFSRSPVESKIHGKNGSWLFEIFDANHYR
jgi:hypothetical protein